MFGGKWSAVNVNRVLPPQVVRRDKRPHRSLSPIQ
jgi:hypothetical protein